MKDKDEPSSCCARNGSPHILQSQDGLDTPTCQGRRADGARVPRLTEIRTLGGYGKSTDRSCGLVKDTCSQRWEEGSLFFFTELPFHQDQQVQLDIDRIANDLHLLLGVDMTPHHIETTLDNRRKLHEIQLKISCRPFYLKRCNFGW